MQVYTDVDINIYASRGYKVRGTIIIRVLGIERRTTLSWRDYDGGDDFDETYNDLPTALVRAALLVACVEGEHGTAFNHSEKLFPEVARDFITGAIN